VSTLSPGQNQYKTFSWKSIGSSTSSTQKRKGTCFYHLHLSLLHLLIQFFRQLTYVEVRMSGSFEGERGRHIAAEVSCNRGRVGPAAFFQPSVEFLCSETKGEMTSPCTQYAGCLPTRQLNNLVPSCANTAATVSASPRCPSFIRSLSFIFGGSVAALLPVRSPDRYGMRDIFPRKEKRASVGEDVGGVSLQGCEYRNEDPIVRIATRISEALSGGGKLWK